MRQTARLRTMALVAATLTPAGIYGQISYQTVAQGGLPAPGTTRNFSSSGSAAFTSVAINGFGQVSFIGTLSGSTADNRGIWAGMAGAIQLHARKNSSAPGGGGSVFGDVFFNNVTADDGRVSFHNTLAGSPTLNGVWEGPIGAPLNVALQGQTVPGSNPSTTFANFEAPGFRGGRVVSRIQDNTLARAIFAGGAGNFQSVARPGDPVPDVPTATFATQFGLPLVNRHGTVVFDVNQSVIAGHGAFVFPVGGSPRAIVLSGDVAGDAGGQLGFGSFAGINLKGFNDAGQVAFTSLISGGPSGGTLGLFVNDGANRNDSRLIARTGAPAPGTMSATYSSINSPTMGGGGHVSFTGTVAGSGITTNNDSGVWVGSSLASLRLVARENDQVPGLPAGVVFSDLSFEVPVVNAASTVAFRARVRGTGVTIGVNDTALFATDGLGTLRLVAREGSVPAIPGVTAAVAPGGIHFVNSFTGVGGQDGKPTSLNDRGQIGFALDLEGSNTDGVFIATVPQQGKVINGTFANGSLSSWTTIGPGTATVADSGSGNLAALLTAGSPVTLSQEVDTLPGPFTLEFDFKFTTTTGTLELTLDGTTLATLVAPGVVSGAFTHFSFPVSNAALFDRLDIPLAMRLDGLTGSQVFIDNVSMTPVPEPGSVILVSAAGLSLVFRRRRPSRK